MRRQPGWVNNPRPGVFYPTGQVPRTPVRLLDSTDLPNGLQGLGLSGEMGHDDHDNGNDHDQDQDHDDTDDLEQNLNFVGSVDGKGRGRRATQADTTIGKLAEPKRHLKVRVVIGHEYF